MSDHSFDAARAAGTYPPKGWGWQNEAFQRSEIARRLAAGDRDAWVLEQARRYRIPVWSGVERAASAFTAHDIALIMAGRKSHARFALSPQPPVAFREGDVAGITNGRLWSISKMPGHHAWHPDPHPGIPCPFGLRGDRLWIAEPWCALFTVDGANAGNSCVQYRDGGQKYRDGAYYDPTNHGGRFRANGMEWVGADLMPRWASRATLQINDVRLERVQDIRDSEVEAEGCVLDDGVTARAVFAQHWDQRHEGSPDLRWSTNPWVWVVEFAVVSP